MQILKLVNIPKNLLAAAASFVPLQLFTFNALPVVSAFKMRRLFDGL
jgi:hypothetical protein